MITLKINKLDVSHNKEFGDFEIADNDTSEVVCLTFDEIEQIYTWAASMHEDKDATN